MNKVLTVAMSLLGLALISGCTKRTVTPLPGYEASPAGSYEATPPASKMDRSDSVTGPKLKGFARRLAPSARPTRSEELLIVARDRDTTDRAEEQSPRCGVLMAKREEVDVPMPLKHTDVKAGISGYIATVEVTQQFHNPYDEKIEAVYLFPLPENAAVNDFIMVIGERRIRGIIREREEAERLYKEARRQGYAASLLSQERPNIFSQSVANIEPGKQIDVWIKYFNTLAYDDGWYEFVFPMVVGPRFNPPGSTEGVGAVARGAHGASNQRTEVEYLAPHERSGHDIALQVDLAAGVNIEEASCRTHTVHTESLAPDRLHMRLSSADSIPNRDFVLRYRVAGDRLKSSLLTHRDDRGGFFTLMLYPPMEMNELARQPMEMVFVLDSSGSMSGGPIVQARAALERALNLLQPHDSFQLINFANKASQLGPEPLPATPANVRRGLDYLAQLEGQGGTMMIEGIKAALDFPHDPERFRFVTFLTDGYIGNEREILAAVHRKLGASRLFSFGVGSSVNRYLMDELARVGRGTVAYLGPETSGAEVMETFFNRVSHPALRDLEIDWGGMRVTDVFPERLPDLFVGRPVIVTGRFAGVGEKPVRIRGRAGDRPIDQAVPVALDRTAAAHPGVPSVWARLKIADLSNRMIQEPEVEWGQQIKQVALDYNLVSAYTSFVAVDASRRTAGARGTTVPVAVPVPDGVRYETTVTE